MKLMPTLANVASAVSLALLLTGCSGAPARTAEHKVNLAKLNDADRTLAEAQGYCAVTSEPLGSMGLPIKVIVNQQPVFVCCKGCEKEAKSHPDKTLPKVAELKAKVQAETHK